MQSSRAENRRDSRTNEASPDLRSQSPRPRHCADREDNRRNLRRHSSVKPQQRRARNDAQPQHAHAFSLTKFQTNHKIRTQEQELCRHGSNCSHLLKQCIYKIDKYYNGQNMRSFKVNCRYRHQNEDFSVQFYTTVMRNLNKAHQDHFEFVRMIDSNGDFIKRVLVDQQSAPSTYKRDNNRMASVRHRDDARTFRQEVRRDREEDQKRQRFEEWRRNKTWRKSEGRDRDRDDEDEQNRLKPVLKRDEEDRAETKHVHWREQQGEHGEEGEREERGIRRRGPPRRR